jgi:gamma-glutamylcyclotransferase (GGCT)/AIG2-like uncharacterized protein YtfP
MSHSPPPPDPFTLFVYGTLMRDGRNHSLLTGACFLGLAQTRPRYVLFDLGDHPGMVHDRDGRCVEGELYMVAASRLPALDALEEAPDVFRLEPVEIEGRTAAAYAYFYQHRTDGLSRCEGPWRAEVRRGVTPALPESRCPPEPG